MSVQENLTDQLEQALASKDLSKRADILRRVTDLFMVGSGKYSTDQIDLFDEVMSKLVEAVELASRAAFGSRLAHVADAPRKVVRMLAFDDAIEVAGPVLTLSPRLDDTSLSENALTKGQEHLLAISKRSSLTETVTDILVTRVTKLWSSARQAIRVLNSRALASRPLSRGRKTTATSPCAFGRGRIFRERI